MALHDRNERPRLALLIGAPHEDDMGMHNDLVAMYDALQTRGLAPEEILSLEGSLDSQLLIALLEEVSCRIANWINGELFFYLSGHGFFKGDCAEEARVGIQLQKSIPGPSMQNVYWEEVFPILAVPETVSFTMLVDH